MPTPTTRRPLRSRELRLDIVADHPVVRLRRGLALLDTGSPFTMRAPPIVMQQLASDIRWIVGTDLLRKDRVLLDWTGRRLVVNGPRLRGESIDLVPVAGLFQLPIVAPNGGALAFLDTGAPISYAPASAVTGRTSIGRRRDFYPGIGEFDVELYRLTVRVGSRRLDASFGVLPDLLALALSLTGASGWILGADYFRDRAIELDLGAGRILDAPSNGIARRTTLPQDPSRLLLTAAPSGRDRDCDAQLTRRPTNIGIEGWRCWRLLRLDDGTPILRALCRNDLWHGPLFISDRPPEVLRRHQRVGVHAYRTPGGLSRSLTSWHNAVVYGQVTLDGYVCVHEMGYRAERARIDKLFVRACGLHARTGLHGEAVRPPLARAHGESVAEFCGCSGLAADEWLSYEELESIAISLAARYDCPVEVDPQRARTSPSAAPLCRIHSPGIRNRDHVNHR